MQAIQERNFHLLMGGVFLTSLVLDPALRSVMPAWHPPEVSFVTLVVGLVWLGRYFAWQTSNNSRRIKALRDRVDELEARLEAADSERSIPRRISNNID